MRPRRPWGLRTAKLSPRSWAPGKPKGMGLDAYRKGLRAAKLSKVSVAPGRPSRVVPHADQNEASPSLTGLRTAKLSPRSWASGRSSGVTPYADQNESSPSLGAANCETVATFVGSSEAQWSLCPDQNEASPPLGAAAAKLSSVSGAPGRSSGVVPHAKQNEASPSLGAAE